MTKMRMIGTIDGQEHVLEVERLDNDEHTYHVTLDGRLYEVDAHALPSEIVSVLINNKSYDLDLERTNAKDTLDGRLGVRVRGRVVYLEMLDERRRKMKEAQSSKLMDGSTAKVSSPMPGKVVRLLVKEGDTVEEGQGVVVMEAMKMENELKAPRAGVIKDMCVKIGEAVDGGALLLTLE